LLEPDSVISRPANVAARASNVRTPPPRPQTPAGLQDALQVNAFSHAAKPVERPR
jgi:hypothetical protein